MTEIRTDLAALLSIAIPAAVFTLLTNAYRVIDQYFIRAVSLEAQAAIGSSIFVLILAYASFELLAAGAAPLLARATGAKDYPARLAILGTSLFGALVLSGVLMLAGAFSVPLIVENLGLQGRTAAECERYLIALFLTIPPLALTPLIDQSFISMGNSRTPMVLHMVSLALNIVATPLLIHAAGLGVVGAALASNLSRAVATGIGLKLLINATGLSFAQLRPHPELRRVVRIGAPMALGTALFAAVYWGVLATSVSPLGPEYNAALGIGFGALEGFTWPVFHGVALAVASVIGRQLGAGRKDLARQTVVTALPLVTGLGVVACALFYLAAGPLTAMFASSTEVHRAAIEYAVILSASQLFLAWEALSEGVLCGAGDTRSVFRYSVPFNILRIPLAWFLAFPLDLGAAGIWWAINLTTYAKATCKGWAVVRGKWLDFTP